MTNISLNTFGIS